MSTLRQKHMKEKHSRNFLHMVARKQREERQGSDQGQEYNLPVHTANGLYITKHYFLTAHTAAKLINELLHS